MNTTKKIIGIATLTISVGISILGTIFLIVGCNGCGIHGNPIMSYACESFYFPAVGSIVMIVVGGVCAVAANCFLIFGTKSKPL